MSELPLHLLPTKLKEIAEYCGEAIMWQLWKHYGGGHINVPVSPGPEHPLYTQLTPVQVQALCQCYGGETLSIPKADSARRTLRNRMICEKRRQGVSVFNLAREYNLTERQIIAICGKHVRHDNQIDLFDEN